MVTTSILAPLPARAQADAADEKAVLAAVQKLFDAMKDGDAEKAREVLVVDGQFMSLRPGEGGEGQIVQAQSNETFLEQLAAAQNEWLERMWDAEVMIHGDLALVWTPYDFHRDGEFSHCGIDVIDVIRIDGAWKVAGGTYTVEREGCPDSPLGPPSAEGQRNLRAEDTFAIERVGSPRVSPDGEWIAYTVSTTSLKENKGETRIWMVPATGGDALPMTGKGSSASRPRWSPDGKYLSFLASRGEGKSQVWLLDRRGGEAVQLTEEKLGVSSYDWSPDATRLLLVMKDPEPDEQEGEEKGEAADVPDPWVVDRLQTKQDYVGYLDRRRNHIYVFDIAEKKSVQITSGDYDDSSPAWSPDGTTIAFVSNRTEEPDSNYDTDIWLVDADNTDKGKTLVQVTQGPGSDTSPAWLPDGRRLVYVTTVRPEIGDYQQTELAIIGIDGGGRRVLTTEIDRNVGSPQVSSDGATIYFGLEDSGEQHLASIPTASVGTDLARVTRVIGGQRSVRGAHLGAGGTVTAVISEPQMPGNLFARDLGQGSELRQLTHNNDELLSGIRLGEVEKVRFNSSDGTEVEAFIIKPPSFNPDIRYPTILWIHGGPMAQYDFGFDFEGQLLAADGYVVVMPNPRGSTGYGQDFELGIWADWGNVDTQDVLAAVDHAVELGYADPDRLGVGGWSYGGILTNYVITSTERFKAAVSGASGALWVANYGHDHYQRWYEIEFGLPWENREIWERLSPFNKVTNITTPTMWVGGEKDWNVPIQNSEQMYQAMKRLGRETLLVVYPNQHHGIDLPVYYKDLLERITGWFDKYLKPE
jgi:dipeptidyl aminopeptidase/acylaminoacyl peptidase